MRGDGRALASHLGCTGFRHAPSNGGEGVGPDQTKKGDVKRRARSAAGGRQPGAIKRRDDRRRGGGRPGQSRLKMGAKADDGSTMVVTMLEVVLG